MRPSSGFPLLLFPMLSDCFSCRQSLGDSTSGLERTLHAMLHWLHSAPVMQHRTETGCTRRQFTTSWSKPTPIRV